jgi:TPR repeat protein
VGLREVGHKFIMFLTARMREYVRSILRNYLTTSSKDTTTSTTISIVEEANRLSGDYESGQDGTLLKRIIPSYEKAALLDNEEAMYRLGRIYVRGWARDDPVAQR